MTRKTDRLFETPRVLHRQVRITTTGSAGSATGTAFLSLPPGRVTHLKIDYSASAAATGDVIIKSDSTVGGSGGTTIFTADDNATDIAWRVLGQPSAVDEARNATAATDGVEGGAFVRGGLYFETHDNDAVTDCVVIDILYEVLRHERITLISQSGADGAGAVTRTVPFNGAGNLLGLTIDFQNMPATTDITVYDGRAAVAADLVFTSGNSTTDTATGAAVGIVGVDEGNAAIAATDGAGGGIPFREALHFVVAQADAFTSENEKIVIDLWVRQ